MKTLFLGTRTMKDVGRSRTRSSSHLIPIMLQKAVFQNTFQGGEHSLKREENKLINYTEFGSIFLEIMLIPCSLRTF